jgi:hypothetical protein
MLRGPQRLALIVETAIFPSLVLFVASVAGAADSSLQANMNTVLKADPRNSGVAVSVQTRSNQSVLVYDLRAVALTKSMADVFRVFLQFAQTEKSRQFKSVELAFRGHPRFLIDGKYFKELGEEFGTQNPVYTMRTFPENLSKPDGSRAYPTWNGGLIGVVGKQTEDFNDFHRQWWMEDVVASAAGAAGTNPQLQPVSAPSAPVSAAPAAPPSSRIVSPPSGDNAGKGAPVDSAAADSTSNSPSEPLDLPGWLVAFPGSVHHDKIASRTEVAVGYTAPDSTLAVTDFYKDQFRKGEVTASASFDGSGTTIRASATGQTCVLRISDADAGTNINVKCAPTQATPAPAISPQPARLPPGVHLVEYSISGSAQGAGLTYRNATGGTEQNEVSLPQTFRFYAASGSFVYLSAQNKTDTGYVHVSITVDGTPLQEATAGSAYGIATASGSVSR